VLSDDESDDESDDDYGTPQQHDPLCAFD